MIYSKPSFALGKLKSRELVDFYLNRIETLNPLLRSVIEVNPDAKHQADEADRIREWQQLSNNNASSSLLSVSSLLGIPVLLKDSIGTKDKLNTTAGSYALLGSKVPRDAGVVKKLRDAGAVILGKASMSEWYHLRCLSIPDGWCARSGQAVVSYYSYHYLLSVNELTSLSVRGAKHKQKRGFWGDLETVYDDFFLWVSFIIESCSKENCVCAESLYARRRNRWIEQRIRYISGCKYGCSLSGNRDRWIHHLPCLL